MYAIIKQIWPSFIVATKRVIQIDYFGIDRFSYDWDDLRQLLVHHFLLNAKVLEVDRRRDPYE